ncbi:MAG: AAA family ATPase [Deltaproteobacteria bacterium]|nr:AAA family ATPase [Deltaproteobacteria bacterium]
MALKFNVLEIKQFRAIRQLKIDGLGRVNLLTGRNNTGKSSVLEAIRLLASEGSPSVIYDILRSREEDMGETGESTPPLDADGLFQLSSLFPGFPRFSAKLAPIVIAATGGSHPMNLSLQPDWVTEERQPDGSRKLIPQPLHPSDEQKIVPALVQEIVPALIIATSNKGQIVLLELMQRYAYSRRTLRSEIDEQPIPCLFVSPYGGERTTALGPLWDKIALSDNEKDVVAALRIIDPEISGVSMVGGAGSRPTRTAIVRAAGISRPVPLRSFGDGVNRLFGIILSLVNAKGGLLLIDEFENGLHHTVQADAWRIIFKLAVDLDIQVVATSHSWDAIEAFQQAASEVPEEGVLIRLSRRGQDIIPTLFSKDEMAVVTLDHIEVR